MLRHPTRSRLFLLVLRAFSPGSWSVPAGSSDVRRVLSQAPGCFSRTLGQPPARCSSSCQASRCLSHSSPVSLCTCSPLGTRQRKLPISRTSSSASLRFPCLTSVLVLLLGRLRPGRTFPRTGGSDFRAGASQAVLISTCGNAGTQSLGMLHRGRRY